MRVQMTFYHIAQIVINTCCKVLSLISTYLHEYYIFYILYIANISVCPCVCARNSNFCCMTFFGAKIDESYFATRALVQHDSSFAFCCQQLAIRTPRSKRKKQFWRQKKFLTSRSLFLANFFKRKYICISERKC